MPESAGIVTTNPHAARSAEIALGIRSARALALVRGARPGSQFSPRERTDLVALRDALAWAAETALREPNTARLRGRRNIASVGLALSAATRDAPTRDLSVAAELLRGLTSDLEAVIEGKKPQALKQLTSFLSALVAAANQSTARAGETLVTAKS